MPGPSGVGKKGSPVTERRGRCAVEIEIGPRRTMPTARPNSGRQRAEPEGMSSGATEPRDTDLSGTSRQAAETATDQRDPEDSAATAAATADPTGGAGAAKTVH